MLIAIHVGTCGPAQPQAKPVCSQVVLCSCTLVTQFCTLLYRPDGYHRSKSPNWFSENVQTLTESFEKLRFHVMLASDPVQGKVSIEVDGPAVVGSISFWNKGDVTALAVDKTHKMEHSFDDRVLTADEDVSVLLRSYFERFQTLAEHR